MEIKIGGLNEREKRNKEMMVVNKISPCWKEQNLEIKQIESALSN